MPHLKLQMIPQIEIFVNKNVTSCFFFDWLPLKSSDIKQLQIIYRKISDLNANFKVEVEEAENGSSNTTINADFDFTHRFYKYYMYSFKDFLKNYGALKATIYPIFLLVFPLLALVFLYKLAGIIQRKYDREALAAIRTFYQRAKDLFLLYIEKI